MPCPPRRARSRNRLTARWCREPGTQSPGYREFRDPETIRDLIKRANEFDAEEESPESARTLLIFQTSKQQTWLAASATRLSCVLDDIRKQTPRLQWSVPTRDAADVETHSKTDQTGLIDIGRRHRAWLYSKRLFPDTLIQERVRELIAYHLPKVGSVYFIEGRSQYLRAG